MKQPAKTLLSLSFLLSASFYAHTSNRVAEIEETLTNLSLADPTGQDIELQSVMDGLRKERDLLLEESRKAELARANDKFLQGAPLLPQDVHGLDEDGQLKLALLMSQKEVPKLSALDRLKEVVRKRVEVSPEDFQTLTGEEEFELIRYISEVQNQEKNVAPLGYAFEEDEINQVELYQMLNREVKVEEKEIKEGPLKNEAPINLKLEEERKIREEQDRAYERSLRRDVLKEKMGPLAEKIEVLGKTLAEVEEAYKLAEEKALNALKVEIENLNDRIKVIESWNNGEKLKDNHPLITKLKKLEEELQKTQGNLLGDHAEQLMQIAELGQEKKELEVQYEEMKREFDLLNQ